MKTNHLQKLFILTTLLTLSCKAYSKDVEHYLTVKLKDQVVKKISTTALLKDPDTKTITIPSDVSYKESRTYLAVPVKNLFNQIEIPNDATIQFKCLDGFSAPLLKDRLLKTNDQTAIPYIAIEPLDAKKKWPNLKGKNVSAGPFYLVWMNPEKSNVGPEEWPYQLAGFEIKQSLAAEFPAMLPDIDIPEDHAVRRGYQTFVKNCFACHTMNGAGHAQMGPDLNLPSNPTEYLKGDYLQTLIRNPQNLRTWPQSKMSAFPESVISDSDMKDLISYLKHMTSRRAK